MRFPRLRLVTLPAIAIAVAAPLHAQQVDSVAVDPHWRPYLGCWHTSAAGTVGPTTCVIPTASPATVEMLALVDDRIVSRTSITASQVKVPTDRDGCRGSETGRWSGSTHRLYTRAEYTCEGSTPQTSSGIFALSDPDAFSRIEGVNTASGTRIRVINYVRLEATVLPSAEAQRLGRLDALPLIAARADAAAPITLADVAAAVKEVDSTVVAAWLADRGQRFALGPKSLRQLRADGVPASIIDMMIAVTNPKVFAVAPSGEATARPPLAQQRGCNAADIDCIARAERMRSPTYLGSLAGALYGYGYGNTFYPYDDYGFGFGARRLGAFGYWLPYGLLNAGYTYGSFGGNPYGLGGYGYGAYGGYGPFGNSPFIIVPNRPAEQQGSRGGRVINGQGYSQSGGSTGGSAQPTSSVGNQGYSGGGGGGGGVSTSSGGSASGGGAASSGSSTGRTAKERP